VQQQQQEQHQQPLEKVVDMSPKAENVKVNAHVLACKIQMSKMEENKGAEIVQIEGNLDNQAVKLQVIVVYLFTIS